jgi:hypothetical protein
MQEDSRRNHKRYAIEMGSVAMIHIPSFIKIGSFTQKPIHRHADRIGIA